MGTAPSSATSPEVARRRESPDDHLFRLLVEAVQDYAVFLLHPDGRIASWNPGAERLKGYTEAEVLGRHFALFFPEEGRRRGEPDEVLRQSVEAGCYEADGWRVRKDGRRFWAHTAVTPIRDEDGRLVGFAKVTQDRTRERAAEQELRESEERYRLLADMIPQHVWTADPDGAQNYSSRRWYEFTGLTPERSGGDGWLERIHPDDRERTLARWRHSLRTGEPYAIEYRFRSAEGDYHWFLGQAMPQRDEEGRIIRWFGTLTDITERKRLDEERERLLARERTAREQVTRILESITDAFVAVDPEWRFTYLNRRGREVIGAFRAGGTGELIGESLWDALPEVRGTEFETAHRVAMAERRPVHLEAYLAPWERWFEVHDYPSDSGLAIYFRDVTKRKHVEEERERLLRREREARAEAEQRAREEQALREAVGAIGATVTTDEVIRQIAASAVDATGADGAFVTRIRADRGEVEVVAVAGGLPPPLAAPVPYETTYTRKVSEGKEPVLIHRLADLEGPLRDGPLARECPECSAFVVPLADPEHSYGALFLVRQPDRPVFSPEERARARTFGELAALTYRRLHLLEESERRRQEVERITESRTRLMRGFSHDVKNPLGAADGYAQLLDAGLFGELTEKQRESLQRIRRSIRTSLRLVDDLLELARAETGQIELECVVTDVALAAREVADDFRAQATAAGLSLDVRVPKGLAAETDPTRLRQILANLVSNAVKYAPNGRVTLDAETRADGAGPRPGAWIAVRVADTGPGIAEDKREQIFQEFTRLDPTAQQGAGVGLAISRRIARLMGGDLTVDSETGHGSTFTVWIPGTPPR